LYRGSIWRYVAAVVNNLIPNLWGKGGDVPELLYGPITNEAGTYALLPAGISISLLLLQIRGAGRGFPYFIWTIIPT